MSVMNDQNDQDVSLMAIDQYMHLVKCTPHLGAEEEAQLLECVAQGKAEQSKPCPDPQVLDHARQARDRLVEGYQPLVIYLAKHFLSCCRSMELLDLIQEGAFGLLRAIEEHQIGTEGKFSGLVSQCVRHAICRALWERDSVVRLPQYISETLSRMRKVARRLRKLLGRDASLAEIAQIMQVSAERLAELMEVQERCQEGVESLQGLLTEDDAEDRHDFVSLFATAVAADAARRESLAAVVKEVVETALTPRQGEVVRLRYGLGEQDRRCLSYREAAQQLGVRPKAVWKTEKLARARLQRELAPVYGLDEEGWSV